MNRLLRRPPAVFPLSLEEERQPKIWKSRVTNGEERLMTIMFGTLLALFGKEERHGNS